MNRKKPTGIMQQGHYFHLKERAERIFGARLVSVKMYNRFIEVVFVRESGVVYCFPADWSFVGKIDGEKISLYIHDWHGHMDVAMRQFNPFWLD